MLLFHFQSFGELTQRPLIVDLTVEEGQRLKVLYGTKVGFHAIDVDTASIFDLYIPQHVSFCGHAWKIELCILRHKN